MGYMGFGMRKEDYNRKPKHGFKNVKEYLKTSYHERTFFSKLFKPISKERSKEIREEVSRERKKSLALLPLKLLIAILLCGLIFLAFRYFYHVFNTNHSVRQEAYHNLQLEQIEKRLQSVYYLKEDSSEYIYKEYFKIHRTIRVEAKYKNAHLHGNYASYYSTGEQFRSALYYYDTLVIDMYLSKSGDTLKYFPTLQPDKKYKVKMLDNSKMHFANVEVDNYKIVEGTYEEIGLRE